MFIKATDLHGTELIIPMSAVKYFEGSEGCVCVKFMDGEQILVVGAISEFFDDICRLQDEGFISEVYQDEPNWSNLQ